MSEFDPEQFEDKYANYFPQLQKAYQQAFEVMNDRYDSELVHAIDQQVLNESEPFYDEDRGFYVELPESPSERLTAVIVDDEKLSVVMEEYVDQLESELHHIFGVDR
jgi:hypothetical protein